MTVLVLQLVWLMETVLFSVHLCLPPVNIEILNLCGSKCSMCRFHALKLVPLLIFVKLARCTYHHMNTYTAAHLIPNTYIST